MRFTVVGLGYVGTSTAALMSQKHQVSVIDISAGKLEDIKRNISPIADEDLEAFFAKESPDICIPDDKEKTYSESDFVLIATPTNYDGEKGHLETVSVESTIEDIAGSGGAASIVIKSTVPTGFMRKMQDRHPDRTFLYVPEFLREGSTIQDQMHPSRIVVGLDEENEESRRAADRYVEALLECIEDKGVPVLKMSFNEAESVKLFANTYLAMRVAFFNELDTFAEKEGYDTKNIIDGVCLDPRIGDWYNNPSFGYGGYCLPKDTRQLLSHYDGSPQELIHAIVSANDVRKDHVAEQIVKTLETVCKGKGKEETRSSEEPVVGIYRLVMKSGSNNFRDSSVLDVIDRLTNKGVKVIIYEPILADVDEFKGIEVIEDLDLFKKNSDLIVANRIDESLDDVRDKVYTRDIFIRN